MNRNYRMLAYVPRWGIAPRHHPQNVAEHSYFVTLYAAQLCDLLHVSDQGRLTVMEYALLHDVREAWESDIPGPTKRALIDPERARTFHDQFAAQMDPYYRSRIDAGTDTVTDGYGVARPIRDIVKVADLIDSVFYLKMEIIMGNTFASGLFWRDRERLGKAARGLLHPELHTMFGHQLEDALVSLELTGAVLPVVDTDLPKAEPAPFETPYLPGDGPEYPTHANPSSGHAQPGQKPARRLNGWDF